MFRNVVIGVDGTSGGRDAIALARRLAAPDAVLTLANVYVTAVPLVPSVLLWDETERERSATLAQDELAHADLVGAIASIGAASPGEGLHRLAEQMHADLLVVGSARHGILGRVLLGDDARASLNGAPCAVAIAPREYAAHDHPIERIGVGYDETDESALALRTARSFAKRDGATVEALYAAHVPTTFPTSPRPDMGIEPEMLDHASKALAKLGGVTATAVVGNPEQELVGLGHRVDLLVVGSRGYGPFRRMLVGSTSEYLQRHAPCALLVVPRPSAQPDSAPEAAVGHADVPAELGDGS